MFDKDLMKKIERRLQDSQEMNRDFENLNEKESK